MTQKTTLPTIFSGGQAADLPKFLPAIPASSRLVRRYSGLSLDASQVGSAVASVPDQTGNGEPLAQSVASKRPTLRRAGNLQYLEFDAIDDNFTAAATISGPQTVAVVARIRTGRVGTTGYWPIINITGTPGSLALSLSDTGALYGYAGKTLASTLRPGTSWHVFLTVFNAASTVLRMDSTETTGDAGPAVVTTSAIDAGTNTSGNGFIPLDLAEYLIWDRALTATERTNVVSELQAIYSI